MPNRSSKRPTPKDLNLLAARIVQATTQTGEKIKDPLAVELGRRGGLKGGKARAHALSKRELREIAKKAAEARWKNQRRRKTRRSDTT